MGLFKKKPSISLEIEDLASLGLLCWEKYQVPLPDSAYSISVCLPPNMAVSIQGEAQYDAGSEVLSALLSGKRGTPDEGILAAAMKDGSFGVQIDAVDFQDVLHANELMEQDIQSLFSDPDNPAINDPIYVSEQKLTFRYRDGADVRSFCCPIGHHNVFIRGIASNGKLSKVNMLLLNQIIDTVKYNE